MGSALERHTAGQGAPAVQETARELAAASVSANTRRAHCQGKTHGSAGHTQRTTECPGTEA